MKQELKLKGWALKKGKIIDKVLNRYKFKDVNDNKPVPYGQFITREVAEFLINGLFWKFPKKEFTKENFIKSEQFKHGYSVSFDRSVIELILSQKNCQGIRCYYAKRPENLNDQNDNLSDENMRPTVVLIGYKADDSEFETGTKFLFNKNYQLPNINFDHAAKDSDPEEVLIAEVGGHNRGLSLERNLKNSDDLREFDKHMQDFISSMK